MKLARVLLVLGLLFALVGCSCTPDTAPEATPASESTAAAEATTPATPPASPAAANEGLPIVDISDKAKAGADPDRTALLDVAHAATGITDDFYVWQLYVQGSTAVGDLQGSTSGKRVLVAFERSGQAWAAVHQVRFIDASEDALLAAAPSVTGELAERVDFVVPVAVDAVYTKGAGPLVASGKAGGVAAMAVYAPTRLPEGFALTASRFDEYSAEVSYASGSRKLAYTIIVASDYGEFHPEVIYDDLRFGDQTAFMDGSFDWSDDLGPGPHLMTGACGEHYLQGDGISPGMVAAVAESMVRVK